LFEKDLLRFYEPSLYALKTTLPEEILRRQREDYYRCFHLLDGEYEPIGGHEPVVATLDRLLFAAALRGYTMVESVRRSFSEIMYMISERRHALMTTHQLNH